LSVFQAILLGIVQGATEFIPVSSSGHLVLVPWLLGWDPPGLAFTVVVHFGTVFGVLAYFWVEWIEMASAGLRWLRTRSVEQPLRLLLLILLGCIPAGVLGLLFHDFFEALFTQPLLTALMLLVTAALLTLGERVGRQQRDIAAMTWVDSLWIGLAQAIAIIPGISRSGATITGGRLQHLKREDAARFSFMLSTPLIVAAGVLQVINLIEAGMDLVQVLPLAAGFVSALASSYLVIRWLLKFLRTRSMVVFAIYCVVVSLTSIVVFFLRAG